MDTCHTETRYDKLEQKVVPCLYNGRDRFIEMLRQTIALNGSFFSSPRMVTQHCNSGYSALAACSRKVMV